MGLEIHEKLVLDSTTKPRLSSALNVRNPHIRKKNAFRKILIQHKTNLLGQMLKIDFRLCEDFYHHTRYNFCPYLQGDDQMIAH